MKIRLLQIIAEERQHAASDVQEAKHLSDVFGSSSRVIQNLEIGGDAIQYLFALRTGIAAQDVAEEIKQLCCFGASVMTFSDDRQLRPNPDLQ